MDGREALPTARMSIQTGESYEFTSPEIPGYIAVKKKIMGVNHGRNEEWTEIYIPNGVILIEEHETPLYAGITQIHEGLCGE